MTSAAESEPFGLLGSQTARIRSVPDFARSLGPAAVELLVSVGLALDIWQQSVLADWLGIRDDGKWSVPSAALVCPRQNGKSLLLAAREIAGLFLLDEALIVHSSHEQATASEQFRLVLGIIEGAPELKKRMLKPIHGKGSEAIEFRNGQRILFKTRTSGGLRGFTVDCLIFDEAYNLPDEAVAAMMPTTTAAPNPQILYASSAVDQQIHQYGMSLARLRRMGLEQSPGLAYHEWSAAGDDPERLPKDEASDRRVWATANPGLGIRQDVETLANIQATMGPRQWAVEHLGVGDWPSDDPDVGRVITVAAWQALFSEGSRMASSSGVLAFDVAPDLSMATIAGAGLRSDGKVHVGIISREPRFSWIAPRIAELVRELRPDCVVCDLSGQAKAVLPELEKLNIEIKVTNAKEYAQACSLFVEGVENKAIAHIGEPELVVAIDGATTKPLADAFKWDRRKSAVSDLTPLVAVTLAHWGVVANARKAPDVYDLNEMVERLRREQMGAPAEPTEPSEAPTAPEQSGQRFVPLDQMPWR